MIIKKGFSLIESLVVIAIVAIVVAVFVFINATAKSEAVLDKAQTSLIAALQEARNRSAAGFGSMPHGVRIEEDRIILFEGETYSGEGIETAFPVSVSTDTEGLTLVFNRLDAIPNNAASIILRHISGLEKTIIITEDGVIDYE